MQALTILIGDVDPQTGRFPVNVFGAGIDTPLQLSALRAAEEHVIKRLVAEARESAGPQPETEETNQ